MPNTIRIKRRQSSGAAGKPSSLYNGELAFNENDNILYYGYGSGVGGVANSVEQIGGTGYFATRGGTNASGLWPISVTGNSATVTNGVYTTGNQTISGIKTLTNILALNGSETANISSLQFNGPAGTTVYFDPSGSILLDRTGNNLLIDNSTNGLVTIGGSTIQLDGSTQIIAANTASNSVGYFAVFDSNPNSSLTTLKSVSKDQILDDIGAATSGLDIIAGSGLVGGGTLSQNRRFDIGQGNGITVSDDGIAVDSTVVITTGTQTILGTKTFGVVAGDNVIIYGSGANAGSITGTISVNFPNAAFSSSLNVQSSGFAVDGGGTYMKLIAHPVNNTATYFPVFVGDPRTNSKQLYSKTTSELKTDLSLNNVTNNAQIKKIASSTSGNIPFWNGTTGDLLADGYGVETVLTGSSGNLPRADAVKTYVDNMIVSGIATNDAMLFMGVS